MNLYRNGREARIGDHVVGEVGGRSVAGTLTAFPRGLVVVSILDLTPSGFLARNIVVGDVADFWHAEDAAWVNAAGDACQPPVR